ncbi:hypothetical protein HZ994_15350 [Akkermansiaceae bacterium]|nr:hypothetical protein HZ994_15350 [Akkermansiaceae bacterium]
MLGTSATGCDEALATLRALDASVKNLSDTLRDMEASLAATRSGVDNAIKSLSDAKRQSEKLRKNYLQALR